VTLNIRNLNFSTTLTTHIQRYMQTDTDILPSWWRLWHSTQSNPPSAVLYRHHRHCTL